ncbi:uncharacterized protein [Primulina huaijiensis]|uniref:uncharacterized protein n=1 Tax=Primulina huaijiensis TaxID=1492673 RepID=UPI003CC6F76D
MPPRRAASTDRQEDTSGGGRGPPPPPPPPPGDAATRVLEGIARIMEQVQQAPRPKTDIYEKFRRLNPKKFGGTTDLCGGGLDSILGATLSVLGYKGWRPVQEIFFNKHFPPDVGCRLTREFTSLRQGDSSVAEFIRKLYRGCHFVPLIARDAAQKALRDIDFKMQSKRHQTQASTQPQKKQYSGPLRQQGQQKTQGHFKRPGQQRPPQAQGAPKPERGPPCKQCNKLHYGKCMWGTFRCFICKEEGHKAADCPRNQGPTTSRAYVMHAEEVEAEPDSTLITDRIYISGVATYALLDSGATHSFISESFVKRLGIIPEAMDLGFRVSIPSEDQIFTSQIVKRLELRLQKNAVQADLIVLPLPEFDIILGMD